MSGAAGGLVPPGAVLLTGAQVLAAERAVIVAAEAQRRNGLPAPAVVVELLEMLRAAAETVRASSASGSAEVPRMADLPLSSVDGMVSTSEAADMLGCTTRNVRDLAKRGAVPAVRVRGAWWFDRIEIESYATAKRSA